MLCLIAGNYGEASRWAYGQQLDSSEWFFPSGEEDLLRRRNFHVLVIGTAGINVPPSYFDRVYELAKSRGKVNRV